jgi:hypothetical protein
MDILEKPFLGSFHLLLDGLKSGTQVLRAGQMAALILILRHPLLRKMEVLISVMPKLVYFLAQMGSTQRIDFAWSLQESLLRSEQDAEATAQMFRDIVGLFNRYITIRVLSAVDEEALYSDETLMWTAQSMAVLCRVF